MIFLNFIFCRLIYYWRSLTLAYAYSILFLLFRCIVARSRKIIFIHFFVSEFHWEFWEIFLILTIFNCILSWSWYILFWSYAVSATFRKSKSWADWSLKIIIRAWRSLDRLWPSTLWELIWFNVLLNCINIRRILPWSRHVCDSLK